MQAGGLRGENATKQIVRYVGKYLYFLNHSQVDESALLEPVPVQGYLEGVQSNGVGSCVILHRILAHKAAINFMRMTVSIFVLLFLLCMAFSTNR